MITKLPSVTCLKTGAHVHLICNNEWLYGDVFKTSRGDLVMRVCAREFKPLIPIKHFTIMSYDVWFDEIKTSGEVNSTLFADGFVEHGYVGVPV
jgi:hypothetical protein